MTLVAGELCFLGLPEEKDYVLATLLAWRKYWSFGGFSVT